jgi:predicted methyltransferase
MSYPVVLSYIQADVLLAAKRQEQTTVLVSPDLSISTVTVQILPEGVHFPAGEHIDWAQVERIKKADGNCFLVEQDGDIRLIRVFSEATNRMCSLLPTKRTPTMHRIVDINPTQDTLKKLLRLHLLRDACWILPRV